MYTDTSNENISKECFKNPCKYLSTIEHVVFITTRENFDLSVEQTMKLFDLNFPYSFNVVLSNLIFSAFSSFKISCDECFNYLESIQRKEEEINIGIPKIIDIFINKIIKNQSQEAYYFIEQLIERNLIDPNITKNLQTKYFAHYKTEEENKRRNCIDPIENAFILHYSELSKNDFERHKKYIEEGHNPSEITKIIRNDEIEKLQEISSQNNFDYNQTIEPSLYERCSFVNQKNVSLIDYAAFFGSVKCFKYLLMNGANVKNTGKYAVSGGNEEIIHLCEQNHSTFKDAYETAIKFHQNNIFKYIYENKLEKLTENNQQHLLDFYYGKQKDISDLGYICIQNENYEILSYLFEKRMKIGDNFIMNATSRGNLYLVKYFLKNNETPTDIFYCSLKSENYELVKYILENDQININQKYIKFNNLRFFNMY